MKKIINCILAFFAVCVALYACSKENSSASTKPNSINPTLSFNRSQLVSGHPVAFIMQNASDSVVAKWTVSPDSAVIISNHYTWGSGDTIIFPRPGTYTISIQLKKVACGPEAAAHPGMDTCFNSGSIVGSINTTIVIAGDTAAVIPHDTTVVTPHDTTVVIPHDTTVIIPHDTTVVVPHDTTGTKPHDSTAVIPH
jgi:hypothetical protein